MRSKRLLASLLMAVGGATVALPVTSQGAFVNWSNSTGSNGLISWSGGGSTDGLWGDPEITGLTFTFTPDNFRAESSGGGADTVDGLLRFDLDILDNQQITGFRIDEVGSYSILGVGAVNATAVLLVTNRLNLAQTFSDTMSTDVLFPISNANPVGSVSGIWSGSMEIPNGPALPNGINKVTVIVDNTLQASSGAASASNPGGTAFIDKKLAGGGVTISIFIPEPSTLGMALCGLPLLLRRRTIS